MWPRASGYLTLCFIYSLFFGLSGGVEDRNSEWHQTMGGTATLEDTKADPKTSLFKKKSVSKSIYGIFSWATGEFFHLSQA